MSSEQGPGTGKTPSKGDRSARLGMDCSALASSSKATPNQGHTVSSKRPLTDPTSSDEETQHKPERKQAKIFIDLTMDEEDIVEGEIVQSGITEQPGSAPGVETEAPEDLGETETSVSMWSRFCTMKSTEDENLGDFVSVLERCLLDREIFNNRDFTFCMSAYMCQEDMLPKLWHRADYQPLLSNPRYVKGTAVLFYFSTRVFASTARHLQDSLTSDPDIMIRTMQKACE